MRNGVDVNPEVLQWAIHNSGRDIGVLMKRFPLLPDWLQGEKLPSFNKLEELSKALYIPFGYLFLEAPPKHDPIETEFRTISNGLIVRASKNLEASLLSMDTVRQWMREYRIMEGSGKIPFVGSLSPITATWSELIGLAQEALGVSYRDTMACKTSGDTFKMLRERLELKRVLVFVSGFVGSNTRRALDVNEFRAFALADAYAPVIFINGRDSAAGRIFSLLHEFFHLLLGEDSIVSKKTSAESLCNSAVAHFLAPDTAVLEAFSELRGEISDRISDLALQFKLSEHAMAIRLHTLNLVDNRVVAETHAHTKASMQTREGSSGNYWNTKVFGLSDSFARAVITNTLEGHTSYTEAFRLLNIRKTDTFDELTRRMFQ